VIADTALDQADDAALVRRAQQELPYRTGAYEVLIRRHGARLRGLCRRWVHDYAEAEDLAQEVMLKVFFQLPRFRADAAFTSWLWRIAANQCMDHLRKQAARPLDLLEELPDQSDGGRNRSLTETELDAHRLLALLAPEERMVVLLRLFADLEFEEIASALEIGTSAAKMRYQRALQRLRETVAPGAVSAG